MTMDAGSTREASPQENAPDLNAATPKFAKAHRAPGAKLSSGLRSFWEAAFTTSLASSTSRMRFVAIAFLGLYAVIGGRLIYLGFKPDPVNLRRAAAEAVAAARPDLLDRNGEILATDVKTMSVFAEPRRLIDKDEATELLTAALPQVDARGLRERLASKKGFVWVKREVTPHQRDEVFHLGLPGVGLIAENKRVYPNGPIGAHVLGFANIDNIGIAGMEKYIDGQGLPDLRGAGFSVTPQDLQPITLSIDIKATHALRDELAKGVEHFKAKAGASVIMDVNTGEVIAMASLPDYDPNSPPDIHDVNMINRVNVGVYENTGGAKCSEPVRGRLSTLMSASSARPTNLSPRERAPHADSVSRQNGSKVRSAARFRHSVAMLVWRAG